MQQAFCGYCGSRLPPGADFCGICGRRVDIASSGAATQIQLPLSPNPDQRQDDRLPADFYEPENSLQAGTSPLHYQHSQAAPWETSQGVEGKLPTDKKSSRRAVLLAMGGLGLVAVGSGITWLAFAPNSPLHQNGSNRPGANTSPQPSGTGTQKTTIGNHPCHLQRAYQLGGLCGVVARWQAYRFGGYGHTGVERC